MLISEIPDITNRDGRATDEEKLASTTSLQKPPGLDKKAEPEDDLEYFECSNIPTSAAKHRPEAGEERPSCPQPWECAVAAPREPLQPPAGNWCCWGSSASSEFIDPDRAKGCCRF